MNQLKKPAIITLCGSTRFYKEFQKVYYEETMKGKIVLSIGFYPGKKHGEKIGITIKQKEKLDKLHLRKINISDEVFIINKNGYIGESTQNELNYAKKLNKKIIYLEPIKEVLDENKH